MRVSVNIKMDKQLRDDKKVEIYFADKLRRSKEQEEQGKMRSVDAFSVEITKKYGF